MYLSSCYFIYLMVYLLETFILKYHIRFYIFIVSLLVLLLVLNKLSTIRYLKEDKILEIVIIATIHTIPTRTLPRVVFIGRKYVSRVPRFRSKRTSLFRHKRIFNRYLCTQRSMQRFPRKKKEKKTLPKNFPCLDLN